MKKCRACGLTLPDVSFGIDKQNADGLHRYCKSCCHEKQRLRRLRDPEPQRAASRRWGQANKERQRKYHNTYRALLRVTVLTHYSGGTPTCACCGDTTLDFLTIDHINGGGRAHLREIKSHTLFYDLRKRGYPDGFRVLCRNCNGSFGLYGYCPHQSI